MPKQRTWKCTATVWLYPGESANWHFVSLPNEHAARIKVLYGDTSRGWGSLPVSVTVGETTWTTSIFPDKRSGTYLLPLKASVRKAEDIETGDSIDFTINICP